MYKLKSLAKRGVTLGAGLALVAASFLPAISASADALNPLTDRSLTLSSSAPGWDYKDGSGNTKYAQPNSGANGKKTGNTFAFKVSTDSSSTPIKAFTFQYCTTPAGYCMAPGDNGFTGSAGSATRNGDSATKTDLRVVAPSAAEVAPADFATVIDAASGAVKAVPGFTNPDDATDTTGQYAAKDVAGNFIVLFNNAGTWQQSNTWTMSVSNVETGKVSGLPKDLEGTGQDNFITLKSTTGQGFTSGQEVKIIFFGTDNNYITNPGSGSFFVKINTYNSDATQDSTTLVDGGVTVANVMNHSIRIQTKVLETMQFSVGTVDPNTLSSTDGSGSQSSYEKAIGQGTTGTTPHQVCSAIVGGLDATDLANINVLKMGNQTGENSLDVNDTYSTHSFWRLSSNSSAGATVYYSGVTLSNTVGDKIEAIGKNKQAPQAGSEQFGIALTNGSLADNPTPAAGSFAVNYNTETDSAKGLFEDGADGNPAGVDASTITDVGGNASWHTPQLYPLIPAANYDEGAGNVNSDYGSIDTKFAFDESSNSIPIPLASENNQVVDCVTGRMRYIGNIAATTPAGIYTTAINYIAAPQY